jgi:hypothetical protein
MIANPALDLLARGYCFARNEVTHVMSSTRTSFHEEMADGHLMCALVENHGELISASEPHLIAESIFDITSQVGAKPIANQFCFVTYLCDCVAQ